MLKLEPNERMQYCLEHKPAEVLVQRGAVYFPAKTFHLILLNTVVLEWETGVGALFYKGWRKGRRERERMNNGLEHP